MTNPDIVIEDESPKPSFYERYVAFGQKYKTPLYCIGAAGVGAFIGSKLVDNSALALAQANLESAYHEIANLNMDLTMRDDFLDFKKLTPKFLAYTEEFNAPNPS